MRSISRATGDELQAWIEDVLKCDGAAKERIEYKLRVKEVQQVKFLVQFTAAEWTKHYDLTHYEAMIMVISCEGLGSGNNNNNNINNNNNNSNNSMEDGDINDYASAGAGNMSQW